MLVEKGEGHLIVSTADYKAVVELPESECMKWIAVDYDGDIFAYRNKPRLSTCGNYWLHSVDSEYDDFEYIGEICDNEFSGEEVRDVEDSIWELESQYPE